MIIRWLSRRSRPASGSARRRAVGASAAIGVLVLAGCSSNDDSETVALPAAVAAPASIVDATPADGPGVALGEASVFFNGGPRPAGAGGGDGDGDGDPDGASGSDADPADTGAADPGDAGDDDAAETSPDVVETTPAEDSDGTSGPGRLDDDAPTCVAVREIIDIRDQFNELTGQFFAEVEAAESIEEAAIAYDANVAGFADAYRSLLPVLDEAYAVLAEEQPDLGGALAAHFRSIAALGDAYAEIPGEDLARFEEAVREQVGDEVFTEGQAARDEIDAFTTAACGIRFRNQS